MVANSLDELLSLAVQRFQARFAIADVDNKGVVGLCFLRDGHLQLVLARRDCVETIIQQHAILLHSKIIHFMTMNDNK